MLRMNVGPGSSRFQMLTPLYNDAFTMLGPRNKIADERNRHSVVMQTLGISSQLQLVLLLAVSPFSQLVTQRRVVLRPAMVWLSHCKRRNRPASRQPPWSFQIGRRFLIDAWCRLASNQHVTPSAAVSPRLPYSAFQRPLFLIHSTPVRVLPKPRPAMTSHISQSPWRSGSLA
jgi:hypothetical protein